LTAIDEPTVPLVPEATGHPPMVLFLGGIIIGSIASVFLVMHLNKAALLAKKGK
jgi:hypothetical protein